MKIYMFIHILENKKKKKNLWKYEFVITFLYFIQGYKINFKTFSFFFISFSYIYLFFESETFPQHLEKLIQQKFFIFLISFGIKISFSIHIVLLLLM